MQWQCLHCNKNNDESNKFCTICGNIRESARPGKFCTSCGVKLEWSSAFCSNCGAKAASPGVTSQSLTPQTWAAIAHVSGGFGSVVFLAGCIVFPLLIWIFKRSESILFIDHQAKEALNFQITMFICFVIVILLCFVIIGYLLLIPLLVFDWVMPIIAAVKRPGVWITGTRFALGSSLDQASPSQGNSTR